MLRQNRNILIIALIAIVNALGYGIIIPVLYSYSLKYGLSDFQNGLLFSTFSICQFISTPIIGRMSDKYGRRPLLIISILGTSLSFFMMAFAPNALFLFLARALDGITAGNIPVASAVISDTTTQEQRTRGFGIIGASFGFGFIFGPTISALTVSHSASLPFIIAGTISLIAVILTFIFLPETNKYLGEVKHSSLFNFKKLFHAVFDENVGSTLLITLFSAISFSLMIFAYQPFSIKILHLSTNHISLLFTLFGIVGLTAQLFLVHRFVAILGLKKLFSSALFGLSLMFLAFFFTRSLSTFIIASIFLGLSNSSVQTLTPTILSREADAKSQGSIMGLNASYMSIGQILGPIIGGFAATVAIPYPFLAASVFSLICFFLSFHVLKQGVKKESAF
ncbi:MFS transporter [Candidatus Roizmanbacteria bacterium]|nr:MFS transporter [Candidatus Roizmanbacteria bacterium]